MQSAHPMASCTARGIASGADLTVWVFEKHLSEERLHRETSELYALNTQQNVGISNIFALKHLQSTWLLRIAVGF